MFSDVCSVVIYKFFHVRYPLLQIVLYIYTGMNSSTKHIIAIIFSSAICLLFALLLASNSIQFENYSSLLTLYFIIFGIQWIAFIPAYLFHTERFFDLTGGLTYITAISLALFWKSSNSGLTAHDIILFLMVISWALRLSSFLFLRVIRAGEDTRFVTIKTSFLNFLMTWSLQGMWVFLTLLAAIVALTSKNSEQSIGFLIAGTLIWLTGMIIEIVADTQKSKFNAVASNKGNFISTGLWSISRHPNYLGEIILWIGIAVTAISYLEGIKFISLISPLFVYLLLAKISGVPLLEAQAIERWGQDSAYKQYCEKTPVLFPKMRNK